MVVTRAYIRTLCMMYRRRIPAELAQILLKRLGREPHPETYSEQDLYEQSRKIIREYDEQASSTPAFIPWEKEA